MTYWQNLPCSTFLRAGWRMRVYRIVVVLYPRDRGGPLTRGVLWERGRGRLLRLAEWYAAWPAFLTAFLWKPVSFITLPCQTFGLVGQSRRQRKKRGKGCPALNRAPLNACLVCLLSAQGVAYSLPEHI